MDKSRIYIIEENRELLDKITKQIKYKITKLLELQLMPSMLLLFLKQTNVI